MSKLKSVAKKQAIVARLKRAEGQLRGVQRMIEADEPCEQIAQQLAAARKALDKTFFNLVGCVIEQGDVAPDEIAKTFSQICVTLFPHEPDSAF